MPCVSSIHVNGIIIFLPLLRLLCISATSVANVAETQDVDMLKFCGMNPFLGIYVDSDDAVAEIGNENNYYWIIILFQCPSSPSKSVQSLFSYKKETLKKVIPDFLFVNNMSNLLNGPLVNSDLSME